MPPIPTPRPKPSPSAPEAADDSRAPAETPPTVIRGTAQGDTLEGGPNAEALNGNAGNDVLRGGGGDDQLYAAEPNDPEGTDSVEGGQGDDMLYVDAGDTFNGGEGHDQLVARGEVPFVTDLATTSIEETWGPRPMTALTARRSTPSR